MVPCYCFTGKMTAHWLLSYLPLYLCKRYFIAWRLDRVKRETTFGLPKNYKGAKAM